MNNADMTVPQYARYRKEKRLPGGTAAACRKALAAGRITVKPNGRIDPERADREWLLNTDAAKQRGSELLARTTAVSKPTGPPVPVWGGGSTSKLVRLLDSDPLKGDKATFARGIRIGTGWLAFEVCKSARGAWPECVEELGLYKGLPEDEAIVARSYIAILMIVLLEGWLSEYLARMGPLPEIDWSVYGENAAVVKAGTEDIRSQWETGSTDSIA